MHRIATGDDEVALAAAILRYVQDAEAPHPEVEPLREPRAFRIESDKELSSAAGSRGQ